MGGMVELELLDFVDSSYTGGVVFETLVELELELLVVDDATSIGGVVREVLLDVDDSS